MCDCESYNMGCGGGSAEVVLTPEYPHLADGKSSVCVDACIANVILHLWGANLPTLSCCCGHNTENPSVVIPAHEDPFVYINEISKVDKREWSILRWELISYKRTNAGPL